MSGINKIFLTCKKCGNQFFVTPESVTPDLSAQRLQDGYHQMPIYCPGCSGFVFFHEHFSMNWKNLNSLIQKMEASEEWEFSTESPYLRDKKNAD